MRACLCRKGAEFRPMCPQARGSVAPLDDRLVAGGEGVATLDVGGVDHVPVPLDVSSGAADGEDHELFVARVPDLPRSCRVDVDEPAGPELELVALYAESCPAAVHEVEL